MMRCLNCEQLITPIQDRHNGRPLFEGEVCVMCHHLYVIPHRMQMMFKHLRIQKEKGEQYTLGMYEEEE